MGPRLRDPLAEASNDIGTESARDTKIGATDASDFVELANSSPLQDFVALVRRPTASLRYFLSAPQLSTVFVAKVLLVFFVASWIGAALSSSSQQTLNDVLKGLDEKVLGPLEARMNVSVIRQAFGAVGIYGAKALVFISPFWKLVNLIFWVGSAMLVAPMFGARGSGMTFGRIFLAACFLGWLSIFSAIPWIGTFVYVLLYFLGSVKLVQQAYGFSFMRAFVASHLVYWSITLGGLLLMLGFVITLMFAL